MKGVRATSIGMLNPKVQEQARLKVAMENRSARSVTPLADGEKTETGEDLRTVAARATRGTEVGVGKPKRKYLNERISADGHTFDSKKEYRQYVEHKLMEKQDLITDLRVHVRFALFDAGGFCKGEYIGVYTCDLAFKQAGKWVVTDTKSRFTRTLRGWQRTKALMLMCHGIAIRELGGT